MSIVSLNFMLPGFRTLLRLNRYSILGQKVRGGAGSTIELSDQNEGIYLVITNQESLKIIIQ